MVSIETTYLNCNMRPTEITDSYWLFEQQANIIQKYPLSDGKWMQFYPKSQLDTAWEFCKHKYRAGRLDGISSMKVSTSDDNLRASSSSDGVIIFFCGPSEDETRIMQIGEKLLKEIPYKTPSGWMSYKSDEQTLAGTAATGQKKNYLYRLRCATN